MPVSCNKPRILFCGQNWRMTELHNNRLWNFRSKQMFSKISSPYTQEMHQKNCLKLEPPTLMQKAAVVISMIKRFGASSPSWLRGRTRTNLSFTILASKAGMNPLCKPKSKPCLMRSRSSFVNRHPCTRWKKQIWVTVYTVVLHQSFHSLKRANVEQLKTAFKQVHKKISQHATHIWSQWVGNKIIQFSHFSLSRTTFLNKHFLVAIIWNHFRVLPKQPTKQTARISNRLNC